MQRYSKLCYFTIFLSNILIVVFSWLKTCVTANAAIYGTNFVYCSVLFYGVLNFLSLIDNLTEVVFKGLINNSCANKK